jgi:serine/threonine protein kinase
MYGMYSKAEVNFEYRKEIGQEGRNSKAFIAHDRFLDAELVIKQISKADFANPEDFFNESRSLYKAVHPHVVQIQYACACEENIYLALPYYENGSLKSLIDSRSLSVREIVRFSIQICSALHNIHSKGLIHFDIKPDNILLSDRNEALLSDFGLARFMSTDFTAEREEIYVRHVAPEHFSKDKFTSQYDIYQLGLTIYRMVHGNPEFYRQLGLFADNDSYYDAVENEKFPLRSYPEHIPSRLEKIINKCLKADTGNRYESALDVANDLSTIDDNTLDWIHTSNGDDRVWHKTTDTHEYRIEVKGDGSSIAEKKTAAGKWSKIRDFCTAGLNRAGLKKFLREF